MNSESQYKMKREKVLCFQFFWLSSWRCHMKEISVQVGCGMQRWWLSNQHQMDRPTWGHVGLREKENSSWNAAVSQIHWVPSHLQFPKHFPGVLGIKILTLTLTEKTSGLVGERSEDKGKSQGFLTFYKQSGWQESLSGTSLMVQKPRLRTPNAGSPGSQVCQVQSWGLIPSTVTKEFACCN